MSLAALLPQLRSAPSPQLFAQAKAALAQHNLLCPPPGTPAAQLVQAREVLELGALDALRRGELAAFDRYIGLLGVFWDDFRCVCHREREREGGREGEGSATASKRARRAPGCTAVRHAHAEWSVAARRAPWARREQQRPPHLEQRPRHRE
jgi:hypothetical protein